MKIRFWLAAWLLAVCGGARAQTFVANFDTDALGNPIADGMTIDEQYSAWGLHFLPDVFAGFDNPATGFTTIFADNTDMTATATDVGTGYEAKFGNVLHSFTGWQLEDGDANFVVFFDAPVYTLSVDIIGDQSGATTLYAYDTNLDFLDLTFANGNLVETLQLSSKAGIGAIVLTPGFFNDWAAVDNLAVSFTPVPEPGTLSLLCGSGVLGVVWKRRRRSRD